MAILFRCREVTILNVAVTGAGGFIGCHLLTELSVYNALNITAIVRPGTQLVDKKYAQKWVFMDISQPPENAYEVMGKPDVLIHLPWQGLSNYHSHEHFESELPMQYNFLKSLVEQGLKNLLVTGTCLEYGMQMGALSSGSITQPITAYGFAKDMLRQQLAFLQSQHKFNLTWARLFYLYGDNQADSSLLSQLKKAVQRGETKFKMSGGEQLRDYLPIDKVAHQLVYLAQQQQNLGVVNVCSGQPVSIRKLVEKWLKENNWNIELELGYYPYPDYEPLAFWGVPDIKIE
ncbi:MAG: NAD(P)-dependent oxidoreductase [Bacteroidota bacterium]